MKNKALVVIDIQNDITKNYREIVDNLNKAIGWATDQEMHVVYICQNNITPSAKNFLPRTKGADIVPELNVVSKNVFIKTKTNALTSDAFCEFIAENGITEFVVTGADATACVKSTCFNMTKAGYTVTVLSDCVTSYDKKKIPAMLEYYESKSCRVVTLDQAMNQGLQRYRNKCFAIQDYSAAIENMLLTIVELGYQSCWYEGHITDDDRICDKIAEILKVPNGYDLVYVLPIGKAKNEIISPKKKDFKDRAWFNTFGL